MRRILLILLSTGFVLIAASAIWAWRDYQAFLERPLVDAGEVRVWLPPGGHLGTALRSLERLGLARGDDWRWRLLGRQHGTPLAAGEYAVPAGTTPRQWLERLSAGEVVRHRFTIIEGWTVAQLRQALDRDSRLRHASRSLSEPELMTALGCPDCPGEGRFLPETYFFQRGDRDLDLLERAHRALEEELQRVWAGRRDGLPLEQPEELLVLASLIEKEARVARERSRVSGVFVRRLELGMRLQTDPTVVYGLGPEFDGRIRRRHLRTDHPWNTYTRHGLPPTPIALPGRAALEAAAQPADGDALYFVARGDGTHHFSSTLAEHNRAVDRYIRGR